MDLQKVLADLEAKAVGVEPGTNHLRKSFFASFKEIGEPIRWDTYNDKFNPFGGMPAVDGDNGEEAYHNTFLLTNDKLRMEFNHSTEPGTSSISDTWASIVNAATLDLSNVDSNDEIDAAFKVIEKRITPEMEKKFDKAQEEYDNAVLELVKEYTIHTTEGKVNVWPQLGRVYQRRVDEAQRDLNIASREYNRIRAILESNGVDPAAFLIARAKQRFEKWSVQLGPMGDVPYTVVSPNDWANPEAKGWSKYSKKTYNNSFNATNSKLNTKAKTSKRWLFKKLDVAADVSRAVETQEIASENFNAEFQYMVARVSRPWMDTSLLKAKNWYLRSDGEHPYVANCVSEGTYGQHFDNKTNLFLPSVVTGLILVKDLKISFDKKNETIRKVVNDIKGGGSFSLGLFKFQKSVDYHKTKENKTETGEYEEISSDGIQLIGYVSEILPAGPFMDSKE